MCDSDCLTHSTIYLVRHAHADWQPDENRPLSEQGRSGALILANLLSGTPIGAMYSSPSRRALETIQPLAVRLGLDPVIVDDLRERELSSPSAQGFEAAVLASWLEPSRAVSGGESNDAAQGRGIAVVSQILNQHPGGQVVISTHGSLFALILHGFDPAFGYDFWRSLTFPDVYELTFRDRALVRVRRTWSEGVRP